MVLKISSEVEQNLVLTIIYDDDTTKTIVVSEGDYITMAYSRNGSRRVVTGIVNTIHANPYNGQLSRKDWYIVVASDNPECVSSAKVPINNILDLNVLRPKRGVHPINTPNNAMRVTDMRIKDNYLQVSNNDGRSWRTVGINADGTLNSDPVGSDKSIADKISQLIGSDQMATTEEFIDAIVNLVNNEVAKRTNRRPLSVTEDSD
jgi:hypothetical protein